MLCNDEMGETKLAIINEQWNQYSRKLHDVKWQNAACGSEKTRL